MRAPASYEIPDRLICTVNVPGPCGQRASELLLVSADGLGWESHPRCPEHPARDWVTMLRRGLPGTSWVILAVPAAMRGYDPVTDPADGGHTADAYGGGLDGCTCEPVRGSHKPACPWSAAPAQLYGGGGGSL